MKNFKALFNDWLNNEIGDQVNIIDNICKEIDYDPSIWFNKYLSRNSKDYGKDFIKEMLNEFVWFLNNEFGNCLLKYLEPSGYNIYDEPYISLNMELIYNIKGFNINNKGKRKFRKLIKSLSFNKRQELMKDKLFSFIVYKTKLKIFSKKEIRYLKLKLLNECN